MYNYVEVPFEWNKDRLSVFQNISMTNEMSNLIELTCIVIIVATSSSIDILV